MALFKRSNQNLENVVCEMPGGATTRKQATHPVLKGTSAGRMKPEEFIVVEKCFFFNLPSIVN